MARFTARLVKEGYYGSPAVGMPDDIVFSPRRWSANDRGGCDKAVVDITGSAQSLVYLTGWLGDRLEIFNEAGDCVWWGVVWDVEINIDNISYTVSLDDIYNRIAVTYETFRPDGSTDAKTTDWAADVNSVERYGKRELIYGLPDSFAPSAETVRDTLLARMKTASPSITSQPNRAVSANITGMGIWQKAASVYFKNEDGYIAHDGESGSFTIGRYWVSNLISFGTATPPALGTGSEPDEMVISSGTFAPLVIDDRFTVSGAATPSINKTYTVDHQDSPIQIGISGSFAPEAAGANIKLSYGDSVSYDNVAQSFVPATSWRLTHIAIKCRQVGSPTDNIRVGLYPDSGGVPGTFLSVVEKVGSTLFTEMSWVEFPLTTPIDLVAGIKYHIGVRRTGATNLSNGYEIALDENLEYEGGTAQFYNGTAWVTRDPDADMPFRLIGEISSTAQILKALNVVDGFGNNIMQVDSLVPIRQYTVDQHTAMDELNEMLNAGTSTHDRLVVWVARDTTVIVGTEITAGYGDTLAMLGADSKLRFGNGGFYPPGRLIYGQRINMESLLLFDSMGVRSLRGPGVYIQASEYDAVSDTLSVESENAPDPFRILTTKRG